MQRSRAGGGASVRDADSRVLCPPADAGYNLLHDGGVAQLVRACGSYPQCRWFESTRRYHTIWAPPPAGPLFFGGGRDD